MQYETLEMLLERRKRERISKNVENGIVKIIAADIAAYNVDDTSKEKPEMPKINDWDEYWKSFTGQGFSGQKCASCGCVLNRDNRVGAHVRMRGEADNTKNAWIALFCRGCNTSREVQKLRKGSWIVKTKMSENHPNVPTVKELLVKEFERREVL